MEFLCRSHVGVAFIFFSVSVASASVTQPTDYAVTQPTDYAASEGDLPTKVTEKRILIRASRDRPLFSGDLGPNDYKGGPEFINGISPSPGLGLDERILESNDGVYHGNHLKYRGAAANIMASTIAYGKQAYGYQLTNNESWAADDLKAVQGRFNRWRLQQASVTRPPITTPPGARIRDPNYVFSHNDEQLVPGSRRMIQSVYDVPEAYIPANKMQLLDPMRIIRGPVIEPFAYNPFVNYRQITLPTPVTPDISRLSPLEQFRRLYVYTTKRKMRTRKPRPKTTARIQPMNDDEYIPDNSYVDFTTSIIQTYRPDAIKADEDSIKPIIPRFGNEGEGPPDAGYEKPKPKTVNTETYDMNDKPVGVKPFINHIKSLESAGKKEPIKPDVPRPDLNVPELNMAHGKNIPDNNKESEIKEIIGKIQKVELPGDEEFEQSEFNKPLHEESEIKNLNEELLKDLLSPKEEIPKLAKQGLKDNLFINLPGMGKSDFKHPPGSAFKELMEGPALELKSGHANQDEQMDEQLKKLLMPYEEPDPNYDPTKALNKSNNADYVK